MKKEGWTSKVQKMLQMDIKMKTKQKINQIKDLYKQKLRILLQKMNDNTNPRATKIVTSQEQDSTDQIIQELQNNQHLNTFFVLSKFIDCNQIKNQPQFIQILFNDHLQIVIELIEWMLIPNFIIKKKKIKTNVDSYPYQCRQYLKDNWCFYQQMYIAARNKTIDFGRIFNFLRKDYFDKNTIYTALGYFADVFIPFAKYEFCGSFNLSKSLEIQHTSKNVQTLSIMKILPQNLIDQLITYCHYEPVFQFLKTAILVSIQDQRDYQISRLAALKWMKAAKIQNIFSKFPAKNQIVNDQISQSMECLQNISSMLKEMIQNLQPSSVEFSFRNFVLIDIILKSDIIKYSVESLTKSRLCGIPNKINQKLHSSASLNSNVQATSNIILSSSAHITSTIPQNNSLMTGSPSIITDIDQEDIVQILFKILSSIVQIFVRIPRTLNISDQVDEKDLRNVFPTSNQHKSQEYIQIQVKSPTTKPISATSHDSKHFDNKESASKNYKSKLRLITYCEYLAMTSQFHDQMQYLLNNLETISKIVYNQTQNGLGTSISKIIPFSSGQNVKAISFMKLEYFNLLHNCLIMIQIKDVDSNSSSATPLTQKDKQKITLRKMKSITLLPFQLKIQRLHSLQIIKKYLNQNRWNNLAHHTLQKICHLLIICSFGYIKKNIEKDKNNRFSDSFLAYLIQNFTRRDFVFLNTVKFTTQGNLHSLYNIAKDLAYTLNSTNELVIFLNEFEPWKKFIMTDLKNYQQKTFPSAIKPQVQEKQENQSYKLKVDEVDTIKKLIQNIPKRLKWPTKTKNKNMSKSGLQRFGKVLDDSVKLEPSQQHMTISGSKISKPYKKSQKNQLIVGLEDILRRKIQLTKKGSEVRQFQIEDISVIKNINVQQKKHKSQIFQSTKSIEQTDDK